MTEDQSRNFAKAKAVKGRVHGREAIDQRLDLAPDPDTRVIAMLVIAKVVEAVEASKAAVVAEGAIGEIEEVEGADEVGETASQAEMRMQRQQHRRLKTRSLRQCQPLRSPPAADLDQSPFETF